MPKPTSPQPPGLTLTDAGCEDLRYEALTGKPPKLASDSAGACTETDLRFGKAAFAAGCEAQRIVMVDLFRKLLKWTSPPGDWACIRCRPQSDMIKAGFLCAWHEAEAEVERTPEQPTTQFCPMCKMRADDRLRYWYSVQQRCADAFHSQPTTGEARPCPIVRCNIAEPHEHYGSASDVPKATTGEAAHVHEDGKDCGCKDA